MWSERGTTRCCKAIIRAIKAIIRKRDNEDDEGESIDRNSYLLSPTFVSVYGDTLVTRRRSAIWYGRRRRQQENKGAGTDLQSEIELILIVYIDTADAGKPKLRPEHAPYNYKKYMEGNQQELQSK